MERYAKSRNCHSIRGSRWSVSSADRFLKTESSQSTCINPLPAAKPEMMLPGGFWSASTRQPKERMVSQKRRSTLPSTKQRIMCDIILNENSVARAGPYIGNRRFFAPGL